MIVLKLEENCKRTQINNLLGEEKVIREKQEGKQFSHKPQLNLRIDPWLLEEEEKLLLLLRDSLMK